MLRRLLLIVTVASLTTLSGAQAATYHTISSAQAHLRHANNVLRFFQHHPRILYHGPLRTRRAGWRVVHRARVEKLDAYAALIKLGQASMIFHQAWVTGYSTHENLTGCSGGRCSMACGGYLNDQAYTVAANRRLGLHCGEIIEVCQGRKCAVATVSDVTLSLFDFEFTYALAVRTGAPNSYPGFANPRHVNWRRVYASRRIG